MQLLICSVTSKIEAVKFPLYWVNDYLSMLGLKLIHVSEKDIWEKLHNLLFEWRHTDYGRISVAYQC